MNDGRRRCLLCIRKNVTFAKKRDDSKILSTKQSFLIFKVFFDSIISVAQTIVLYLNPIKNGDELKVGQPSNFVRLPFWKELAYKPVKLHNFLFYPTVQKKTTPPKGVIPSCSQNGIIRNFNLCHSNMVCYQYLKNYATLDRSS